MKTLVAIPVYNEEQYVEKVLGEVKRFASDVLVIDDGSTDQTPLLLAKQKVEVIRHAENRGYGQSMIDAFRTAQCWGFDWLITMDCDEQHEPAALPVFFDAIAADDADVISGSRYLDAKLEADRPPQDRRAINGRITKLLNEDLGYDLTDSFCGYKAYRVSAANQLSLSERGYAFPLQFWVQARAKGLRVREIPVRLIYNDPNRSFGGPLNDADNRLQHYLSVYRHELEQVGDQLPTSGCCGCGASSNSKSTSTDMPPTR